jgi:ribonuclease P protein component
MLTLQQRIPKNLFPLLKKNKVYEGEVFSLRATFMDDGGPRVVCIVSKKTLAKAHDRNKVKRQVYSILFSVLKESKQNTALQIFPKKNILNKKYSEIKSDIINIISKNKLL